MQKILSIIYQENFTDDSNGRSSIGAHVQHILDRFYCFFVGLLEASIDYDARKRDPEIKQNVEAAMFALESVARRIEQLESLPFCSELIGVKEFVLPSSPAVEFNSTLERELMGLITYSIHHLAIIALLASLSVIKWAAISTSYLPRSSTNEPSTPPTSAWHSIHP